jgi:CheY-like chemotaxis protein
MGDSLIRRGNSDPGSDFVNPAEEDEFRLVLLDLSMPGMEGWETLAALGALRRDIPVILASGCEEAQVMQGHHLELPRAFWHKPYRIKDLQPTLGAAQKTAHPIPEKAGPI